MTRTITIKQSVDFLIDTATVPPAIINTAIGYLSTWAMTGGNYPDVTIFQEKEGNMIGVYYKPGDTYDAGYVIGAILRGDCEENYEYSFHS